jgi:hypothetical protein
VALFGHAFPDCPDMREMTTLRCPNPRCGLTLASVMAAETALMDLTVLWIRRAGKLKRTAA